jgi:RNA polymerase sigma factor (sigma-70 family)
MKNFVKILCVSSLSFPFVLPAKDTAVSAPSVCSRLVQKVERPVDPHQSYHDSISRFPLLTKEQEIELAMKMEAAALSALKILDANPDILEKVLAELLVVTKGSQNSSIKKFVELSTRLHSSAKAIKTLRREKRNGIPEILNRLMGIIKKDNPENKFTSQIQSWESTRNLFANSNLRLALSFSKPFRKKLGFWDATQFANTGLMVAIDKWDYRLGNKFSTFATWWIKQVLRHEIHSVTLVWVPEYVIEAVKAHKKAKPTSEPSNYTEDEILQMKEEIRRSKNVVRMDFGWSSEWGGENELQSFDVEASEQDPRFKSEGRNLREFLEEELRYILQIYDRDLRQRNWKVIRMFYGLDDGEPKTLVEVGKKFGITRERIRQIIDEFRARAKSRLESLGYTLEDFDFSKDDKTDD